MLRPVPFIVLHCACLCGATMLQGQPAGEASVWHQVADYLSQEAQLDLRDLPKPGNATEQRERDFCTAVVLLAQQSISDSVIDDAERRFTALVSANGDDDIGRASRYQLGRISQIFRGEPDDARAAGYYRGLLAGAVPDHWNDLARIKLAMLELYILPASGAEARVAAVEALIPGTTDRVTRRDLHRLAARGVMFYNLKPGRALEHLLVAESIGGLRGTPAADQVVQIGELAWELGRRDLAQIYRDKLRTEFPREPRIYLIDQRFAGKPVPQRKLSAHEP